MNEEVIKICASKINKETYRTWDSIAKEHSYSCGESLRSAYKLHRKRMGILPSKEEKISEEIKNKLEEIDYQMIELKKKK